MCFCSPMPGMPEILEAVSGSVWMMDIIVSFLRLDLEIVGCFLVCFKVWS